MAEEDGVTVTGHVTVHKDSGLTVTDLRLFLAALDKSSLPDTAELRVRTMWKVDKHGSKIKKIIAVVPE